MHTSSIQQNILAELDHELAQTRRILERVPFAQADYKPHPKSMSLWQLATHTVNLLAFKTLFVTHGSRDFLDPNAPKPGPRPPATRNSWPASTSTAPPSNGSSSKATMRS